MMAMRRCGGARWPRAGCIRSRTYQARGPHSKPMTPGARRFSPLPPWLAIVLLLLLLGTTTATTTSVPAVVIPVNTSTPLREAQVQARAAVASAKAARRQPAVTIVLEKGVHSLEANGWRAIQLGPEDEGVAWTGTKGAVVSGGAPLLLSDFVPVPQADPIFSRFPSAVAKRVVRVNISAYSTEKLKYAELLTSSGVPLTVARWPNVDAVDGEGIRDHWALTGKGSNASGFSFPASAPTPKNSSGTQARGFWFLDWWSTTLLVTSMQSNFAAVAPSKMPMYVKSSGHGKYPSMSRFFFFDQPEFLDSDGEYWIDKELGYVYLLPPSQSSVSSYSLSLSNGLFKFVGNSTSSNSFRGLHMMASQGTAILCGKNTGAKVPLQPCNAHQVLITNCTIQGMRSGGIEVYGGSNWSITHSTISHTRGVGAMLYGGNYSKLLPANMEISNCTITDFNREVAGFTPAVKINGVGIRVQNNVIHHAPGQGLLWTGNDHTIANNVIYSVCLEMFDCGAIYESQRNWGMRGTMISGNLIFAVGRASTHCNSRTSCGRRGVYLDALTQGVTVRDNILIQPPDLIFSKTGNPRINALGIRSNGGRDTTVVHNLCVNFGSCVGMGDCGITWYGRIMTNFTKQVASLRAALANPLYRAKYPRLAILDPVIAFPLLGNCSEKPSCPPAPWGNIVHHNAAVNASWRSQAKAPHVSYGRQMFGHGAVALPIEAEFPASRFSLEHNVNLNGSAASLGFVSQDPAASRCWQLKPDSPLLTILGSPITATVGTDEWRRQWPCRVKTDDPGDPHCRTGIPYLSNVRVCCKKECGRCNNYPEPHFNMTKCQDLGPGRSNVNAGLHDCCVNQISIDNKSCSHHNPPCSMNYPCPVPGEFIVPPS
eukprot:COSAG01_NODE_520_length_16006_cov_6.454077_8_plen_881_part_00